MMKYMKGRSKTVVDKQQTKTLVNKGIQLSSQNNVVPTKSGGG